MKLQTALLAAIAAGGGYLAYNYFRRRPAIDLRGKVVLITGGSRGLGLATAREFGAHGAAIAFCARDKAELDRAREDLLARGLLSHTFVCDVTNRDQVKKMVSEVAELLGPIDILINNVGVIRVGPFADMNTEDFAQAMDVILGNAHTTMAVIPSMRARRQGNIVNITSLGGKVSIPHLLPYSCAKFATVALSEGLRAELAPMGIRVTTIVPGLLRTGSHLHADFKGRQSDEYAWFAAGAATDLAPAPHRSGRVGAGAVRLNEPELGGRAGRLGCGRGVVDLVAAGNARRCRAGVGAGGGIGGVRSGAGLASLRRGSVCRRRT